MEISDSWVSLSIACVSYSTIEPEPTGFNQNMFTEKVSSITRVTHNLILHNSHVSVAER